MDSTKQNTNNGGYAAAQNFNKLSSPTQVAQTVDTTGTHPQSQSTQQPHNPAAANTKVSTPQYTFLNTAEDYRAKIEGWRSSVSGHADAPSESELLNTGGQVADIHNHEAEFDFDMDSASAVGSEESMEDEEMEYIMNNERERERIEDEEGSGISSDSDPDELV